ncbi:MAG TPA: RDD family protein [Syntrophales bacterium]|nr:RDD family protein [Syntrophales bacterium]HOM06858.1 RDD family protein [Syntrophales bacterium]HON99376.1 RDD family protein [Syntrophales bacterium]HPC00588.1 RDD family protein [Syntrophales bacterium]HPQ06399.1 RDD family protein [Syntrophales bacterium]
MRGEEYGGFWRRAAAALVDQVVLNLFYFCIFVVLFGALYLGALLEVAAYDPFETTDGALVIYQGLSVLANGAYFVYFHGSRGQTPGKILLGLRVVPVGGERMTYGIAFLRWVGYLVSALFLFLGYLWVAFDGRKQGWHDKIAGTYVVRTDRRHPEIGLDKGEAIL